MLHSVRSRVLVTLLALSMSAVVLGAAPPAAQAATSADGVHSIVNAHRSYVGLPTLRRDPVLDSVAQEWANSMASQGAMVHSTNQWRAQRMPAGWQSNGENIAYGYGSPEEVMTAWMASPGHRANILRSTFTRMGVGYVANGNFWVQIFGGYPDQTVPSLSPAPVPVVSGTPRAGSTLTVNAGTWGPAPVSLSYQWLANGSPIAGATSTSYRVTTFDVGTSLSAVVWGSKSGYATIKRTSESRLAVTNLAVSRIAGEDRFAGSVALSKAGFPSAQTVYLANGLNYPDALSAAPAAIKQSAPLLLTAPDTLDKGVAAEITRLGTQKVVIVGGVSSISGEVEQALRALVPVVRRVAGDDRYATSRAIAADAFGSGAPSVFIATGANFPDALSSGSAAGAANSPVLLIDGSADRLDEATAQAVATLRPRSAKVAGGASSVSSGAYDSLASAVPGTSRLAGSDRFATSIAVNASAYSGGGRAYLALGYNFPDALAGSVIAGTNRAPLFIAPSSCVPRGILAEFTRTGVTEVTIIGGPTSLDASAAALTPCGF